MSSEVSGRIAVVTGGGSGIGRSVARALANQGASVAVADLSEENATAVAGKICSAGGRARAFVCDVSDRASVRVLQADVERTLGPATLIIANAGVTKFQTLVETSEADIDWLIQVNLLGVINCVHAFLPDMIHLQEGHLVATASASALLSPSAALNPVYVAAKAGVVGLMLSLRRQLQGLGIGTTVVCPGRVATGISNSSHYRPTRFGGPAGEPVPLPTEETAGDNRSSPRTADEVALMVIRAIHDNRAVVVTDGNQRATFKEGFADLVLCAFDQATQFDRDEFRTKALAARRRLTQ
jgi:NAD(P)-dependent dehydrogenase (short-subunit alcohol dehydrogenase family)